MWASHQCQPVPTLNKRNIPQKRHANRASVFGTMGRLFRSDFRARRFVAWRSVAMETSDKHCQTQVNSTLAVKSDFYDAQDYSAMYDETVPVVNPREIESPSASSDEEVVRATMAKFNPPVRHTARHDFDSQSDSDSEPDKFLDNVSGEDEV